MKVLKPLLVILSMIISITQLVSNCSKDRIQETANDFARGQRLVEKERREIFSYNKNDKDSLEWMTIHTRTFNTTVDSCIKYYRDNFNDENREKYTKYLNVFFEYKKLVYAYQGWIRYSKENVDKEKNKKEYETKLNAYRQQVQAISMELGRKEFQVSFDF